MNRDWNGSSQLFQLLIKEGGIPPIPYTFEAPLRELQAHSKYNYNVKLGNDRLIWNDENKKLSHGIEKSLRKNGWQTYNPKTTNNTLNHEFMILRDKLMIYKRFCLSLDIIPEDCEKIIRNNLLLGPAFAVQRKKIFDYSIREQISKTKIFTPEDVKTINMEEGINKFFPSRHLMNWEIPIDYSDILDYSMEEPKIKFKLSKLEERMERFLKKGEILRKINILDSLNESNTKVSFHKGKKMKACDARQKGNPIDVETEYMKFKISWVTKNPDEGRLIAISEVLTRNLILIGREATMKINNCHWDVYGKARWGFLEFLHEKRDRFFIMCDQSKSGWTFPMELMASYFKICAMIYPDFEYFSILRKMFEDKNIIYNIEDMEYKPLRGFILGMWDNIQSFIIACIFDLFVEDELKTVFEFKDLKYDAMFWGDDQIIKLDNCSNLNEVQVWNRWMYYMSNYGLYVNRKKSFISTKGIFCEIYSPSIEINLEKSLIYILMILNSLRGCCTFERKVLWSLYDDQMRRAYNFFNDENKKAIDDTYWKLSAAVQQIIGYEFHEFEKTLPVQFGGWLQLRDEDNNPQILDFIWEKFDSIPKGFVNVGYHNPTFSQFDKPNKGYKKWKKDPFINDLLKDLDNNWFYYDLKESYKQKFKNLHLDEKLSKIKQQKLWIKAQVERQKHFNSKESYTQQKVLYKFFSKGVFKDPMDIKYLVRKPKTFNYVPLQQEKHKFTIELSKETSVLYIQQRVGYKDFGIKFLNENKISFKDVTANCFKLISSSNYVIPTDWYVWCMRSGINPDNLYKKFYEKYLENIFNYFTPLSLKDDEVFKKLTLKEGHFIIWDEEYGLPHQISEDEAFQIHTGIDSQRIKIFSEKLAISYEQYMEKCFLRSVVHTELEEDEISIEVAEVNKILESLKETKIDEPLTQELVIDSPSAITDIADIEDVFSEEEEEVPPEEDDWDPLAEELRRLGLDTVDITEHGNIDDFYDQEDDGDPEDDED